MTRAVVLGTLILIGGLSLAVLAQVPAAPSANAIAAMKLEKVKENLYIIGGSGPGDDFSGGNTAVFITETGVTLVDTKLPGFGQTILDRIRTLTDKPVTRIINTHAHADHTGGNSLFLATVEPIVHENANARMEKAGNRAPRGTFKDRRTVGSGRDQIDLYYFGRGHTDGDAFVVFTALRTMHTGDMFAWKALPFIDPGVGGSILEHPRTLAAAVAGVKNVDTIINGHIPVSAWNDLKEYASFVQDFVTYAERAMRAGKTVDEAAAEYKVPPQYKGYVASIAPNLTVSGSLKIAYDELGKR